MTVFRYDPADIESVQYVSSVLITTNSLASNQEKLSFIRNQIRSHAKQVFIEHEIFGALSSLCNDILVKYLGSSNHTESGLVSKLPTQILVTCSVGKGMKQAQIVSLVHSYLTWWNQTPATTRLITETSVSSSQPFIALLQENPNQAMTWQFPQLSVQPTQPAQPTGATTMTASLKIDPNIKSAINSLLASAGVSIDKLIDAQSSLPKYESEIKDLQEQTEKLRAQLSARPSVANMQVQPTTQGMPSGTVKYAKANKLFPELGSGDTYEIPYFDWTHAHPDVPMTDDNYKPQLAALRTVLRALSEGENAWLHGHTGTGKTSLVEYVCSKTFWPCLRISLDSELSRADFVGTKELEVDPSTKQAVTLFKEGSLPKAIQQGYVLLLDEIDFGRPDILYLLQSPLEGKGMTLLEDGGRVVQRHPMFRIIATANTKGSGDEYGLYAGARIQSQAFRNRFTKWSHIDYLDHESEVSLLMSKSGLPKDVSTRIANFAGAVRQSFKRADIGEVVTPRNSVALAKSVAFYRTILSNDDAINAAMRETIINSLNDEYSQKVVELAVTHLGYNPQA